MKAQMAFKGLPDVKVETSEVPADIKAAVASAVQEGLASLPQSTMNMIMDHYGIDYPKCGNFTDKAQALAFAKNIFAHNGRVVKGVNFEGLSDVSSPVELARMYWEQGADELVFYDITASFEGRALFTDILTEAASKVFIPLTVGGGINTVEDFDRVLKCGADKVSVNSGAIRNPDLVLEAAKKYGDQCVVLSVDVKRVDGAFRVFAKGGRENTGMEAIAWIKKCVELGAGEVVVNSIDTDGVKGGFDIEMLEAVCNAVNVPVIASGGAGTLEHFAEAAEAGANILLAASVFHFNIIPIPELKEFLKSRGFSVS